MADQNQTVHTVFTGEADLAAAQKSLNDFIKSWTGGIGAVNKALEGVDAETLKKIQNYQKMVATAAKAQAAMDKKSPESVALSGAAASRRNIRAQTATITGELEAYRKGVSKSLAGTVLMIDQELKAIDDRLGKIGTQRRKFATEIAQLAAERDRLSGNRQTIASNPFVAAELSGARSAKAKAALKSNAADDRAWQAASEALIKSRLRLLQVETELSGLSAKGGGKAPAQVGRLRAEEAQLQELIRTYEAFSQVRDRANNPNGKMMSSALAKGRREIVTEARSVIDAEQRILELKERIRKSEDGTAVLSATNLKHAQNELRMTEAATAAHLKDEAVLERVARLKAAKANPTGATTDPTGPARRLLDIDSMRVKAEAEINRLRVLGGAEDLKQIAQLQAGLRLLATEAVELSKIKNIEEAITLERLKRRKEPVAARGPHSPNADRLRMDGGVGIMGVQTEVMANYAIISAMTQSAYALGTFIVQYEAALAQFQAIAAASDSETSRLSLTISKLGQDTRFTNLEIAATATLLAQAGLSARETEGALGAIAKLATAAGTELKQAADVVTSIASVWGMTTSEYAKIADVLTAALNSTKLGMDQIQLGIQYAANTAQDAGIGFNELTAALGAMANAGIRSGSTLGTGLRALIVDLETPTDKARASYERLGLTLSDTDIRTQGLTQVLANLKAKGFGAADAFNSFEIRAASAYTALSNNVDVMVDLQGELLATGSATDANAVQMDTLTAKWTTFTNVLKTSGDNAFAPVLTLFKSLLDLGNGLGVMLGKLGPIGQGAAVGVTVLVAALGVSKFIAATTALKEMALAIRLLPPALAAATVTTQAFAIAEVQAAAGATTLAVAETGATAATGALATAMNFLGKVPTVLLLAGLAAITVAVLGAAGAFKTTVSRADELQGEINDLTSASDETKTSIASVTDTMARMTRNMSVMADHPIMRSQVLAETRAKFERIGLAIDSNSNSVEEMIQALGRLRDELQKQFNSELLALADRLDERIVLMNEALARGEILEPEARKKLQDRLGGAARGQTIAEYERGSVANRRAQALGPAAVKAYEMLANPGRVKDLDDPSKLAAGVTPDTLRQTQLDLRNRLVELQNLKNATVDPRKREEIQTQIEDMRLLIGGWQTLLGQLTDVIKVADQSGAANATRAYGEYMGNKANPAAAIPGRVTAALAPFSVEANNLMKTNLKPEDMKREADDIVARARIAVDEVYRDALAIAADKPEGFKKRFLSQIEQQTNSGIGDLGAPFLGLSASAAQGARASGSAARTSDANDDATKAALAKARLDKVDAELDAIEARIKVAPTGAEVELLRQRAAALQPEYGTALSARSASRLQATAFYNRVHTADELAPAVRYQETRNLPNAATAVSPKGALGPMQVMPETARAAAKRLGRTDIAALSEELLIKKLLADPVLSAQLGKEELRYLLAKYDGNTVLALAAYNAGPGRIDGFTDRGGKYHTGWLKTIGDPRKPNGPTNEAFAAAIPIKETREYVAQIAARNGDGTGQDPSIDAITGLDSQTATLQAQTRMDRINAAVEARKLIVVNAALKAGYAAKTKANDAEIKELLSHLTTAEGDINKLTADMAAIQVLTSDNMDMVEKKFWLDPNNQANDPDAIERLQSDLEVALQKAADITDKAMAAYIDSRDAASARNVTDAGQQLSRAQATPGTSQTTIWALGQHADWEAYLAAQEHEKNVSEALTMALNAQAAARERLDLAITLAEAPVAQLADINAQLADPAISAELRAQLLAQLALLEVSKKRADSAVELARTDLDLRTGTVSVLRVQQKNARSGVAGATPPTPIAAGEQSQAGVNDNSPMGMISRAAREYAKTSGVFASTSETIADGISGTFDALASGINKTIQQISNGSITIKSAFQNIMGGILQQLQQTATKIAADAVMKWVLQLVMSWANPLGGAAAGLAKPGSFNPGAAPTSLASPGYRTGGEIKPRRMASGGPVMNRDSVHILAEPGEVMMRKSAVQMVGKQNLLNINALGNRSLSQAGAAGQTVIKKEADKVNVWVVSANQVPPPTAKDIIHHVAQDIAMGGTLKKLVKTVAMGG